MRIKLALKCNSGIFIPFNYNAKINAMILDKIKLADVEYAEQIHNGRSFKFFTFSNLIIPNRQIDAARGGLIVKSNEINLIISSPDKKFAHAFLAGIVQDPLVNIGGVKLVFESMNIIDDPDFSSGILTFKTLTPIITSTKKEVEGVLKKWDLTPKDIHFYSNIRNNIIKKYIAFNGILQDDRFNLSTIKLLNTKRISVKNTFHVGNMGIFKMSGTPQLLEFAYNCGLGERNSMGFGMVG